MGLYTSALNYELFAHNTIGTERVIGIVHYLGTLAFMDREVIILEEAHSNLQKILDTEGSCSTIMDREMIMGGLLDILRGFCRLQKFKHPDGGTYALVHGDYNPSNTLVLPGKRLGMSDLGQSSPVFLGVSNTIEGDVGNGDESFRSPQIVLFGIESPSGDLHAWAQTSLLALITLYDSRASCLNFKDELRKLSNGRNLERVWGVSYKSRVPIPFLHQIVKDKTNDLQGRTAAYPNAKKVLAIVSEVFGQPNLNGKLTFEDLAKKHLD
jgi:hypothetical protein